MIPLFINSITNNNYMLFQKLSNIENLIYLHYNKINKCYEVI